MEEESIKNDRVCQLINLYWDDLTSEEKKQIETANKSMKFFLKHEAWGRLEYEYETMLDILNKGYREIGD